MRSRAAPASSAGSAQRPTGISAARKRRTLGVVVYARIKRGEERAGGERVDGNPGAGQLHGQAAGELDHGALAGGVAGPGGGAGQAQGAGHGHDAAVPGGAHRGGGRAAGQPGAHHVYFQAGPQLLDAELVQGAAGLDADAGHQHVDPAVPGQNPLDEAGDGALASDVAGMAVHGAAGPGGQPGRGLGAASGGPAGQHDAGAGLGQRGGDGQAEPSRAAGDHGDLPGPGQPRRCRADGRLVVPGSLRIPGMIAERGSPGPQVPVLSTARRKASATDTLSIWAGDGWMYQLNGDAEDSVGTLQLREKSSS